MVDLYLLINEIKGVQWHFTPCTLLSNISLHKPSTLQNGQFNKTLPTCILLSDTLWLPPPPSSARMSMEQAFTYAKQREKSVRERPAWLYFYSSQVG